MESVGLLWSLPRTGETRVLILRLGILHFLEGPCQVECANVSSLLGFKNSHWIREELTLPHPKQNKKFPTHQKKIVLNKSHQYVRMLNAEQTACNFQFFPLLPVESSTLPPSMQGHEFQGRLAKRANLQQFLKICK